MKGPCPDCGSSDAREDYGDHHYCFSCHRRTSKEDNVSDYTPVPGEFKALPKRAINEATCRKFGYVVGEHHGRAVHLAPLYDGSELVGQKTRDANKRFQVLGRTGKGLWGQQVWRDGGKMVVVTEGELDAMAVAQAFDLRYPAVSLPNGSGDTKSLKEARPWLDTFERVVLMFDMDGPGREAVEKALPLCPPGKTYVAHLPRKDANQVLIELGSKAIVDAAWGAARHKPDNLVTGEELWDVVTKPLPDSMPTPWDPLNAKIRGLRPREIMVLTGGSGCGKSTVARHLAEWYAMENGTHVGYIPLEETAQESILRMASVVHGRNLWLDPKAVPAEELRRTVDSLGRTMVFHDGFAGLTKDTLGHTVREMVSMDCKVIVLDHISIVISASDTGGNERREIDELMTAMRSLCQEVGASFVVISHLRRPHVGPQWEEGRRPMMADLRGSAAIEQLADTVIGLSRNMRSEDPQEANLVHMEVLKNRRVGLLGMAGALRYDHETGRMVLSDGPADLFGE